MVHERVSAPLWASKAGCVDHGNHDAHISLPVIEAARANDVVLIGFPGHTTHILQPMDVKVSQTQ
ncbi:hypothetical protein DPMN_062763 [Dreissena polymorpha]|uniref:Uncharacterized protein n=1 Tax=Dreissena polymorpha TaxID=45954 RepID=A0A9D4CAF7_DREPO|nr:hypothetical protein DPMN_062763 [Dreissena polymorpha]